MNAFEKFFCYCAGSSFSILKKCPTEMSKHVGIGATIFFTGLLAAISSAYALHFVFDRMAIAILFGTVWGLMIFNLDRYIVLSMRKSEIRGAELKQAIPRFILAILIAMVISKPLELKIFEKEIATEITLMQAEILGQQEGAIRARYANPLDSLNKEKLVLEAQLQEKTAQRDRLVDLARQEADGTGGSGKVNPGPIYLIKKKNVDVAQAELDALQATVSSKRMLLSEKINSLDMMRRQEVDQLVKQDINGISFQLTALNRMGEKYSTIYFANLFIVLLFIMIEISPIVAKLLSKSGPYDDLLSVHEKYFETYKKEKIQKETQRLERVFLSRA